MKKRILSVILAITVFISSFSFASTAYASSQQLMLDVKRSIVMSGVDDLEWFYYTPSLSGTYSLLSYNNYACEAYLFIKEVDTVTKQKRYVQLAYSNSDPDYAANNHGNRQFCLTYHLEQGVTYYYAVGWYLSSTRTDGIMNVMLRNDSYDNATIDRIELGEPPTLDAYTDGSWVTDASGESYFRYNTSKLVSNLEITVYYKDGTSSTTKGSETIDGYPITFIDNQYENHWYPNNSAEYTENTFTVKINNVTASVDVPITIASQYSVKGKVIDMNGNPVANATISRAGSTVAVTDSNGAFTFYHTAGKYEFTVSTTHSINRNFFLQISTNNANNNFSNKPIQICNCDFVRDGIVNAKDFAFINRYATEQDKLALLSEFRSCINFTAADYI